MNPSQQSSWNFHLQGATQIVKHRAPSHFREEFDKALFAAYVGPIVYHSLTSRRPCYLQDLEWKSLYESLIQQSDSLTHRSLLTIRLRKLMFRYVSKSTTIFQTILYHYLILLPIVSRVPGLCYELEMSIIQNETCDDDIASALQERCRLTREELQGWWGDYTAHCVSTSLRPTSFRELSLRRELLGMFWECVIIVNRLLSTLVDEERIMRETETQTAALALLKLQDQCLSTHSWLFTYYETGVAQTVILTKDAWLTEDVSKSTSERRVAMRERYIAWTNMLQAR